MIRRGQSPVSLQPVVQEFLAYLLLNRHRFFCRATLAGLFWGGAGENQARRCLSTTLWRLRQELEPGHVPAGTFVIVNDSGEIGFNCQSRYRLDVATFEEQAGRGLGCPLDAMGMDEAEALEEATQLYAGDLLEGLYSDWVLSHRERLRAQYIRCQIRLMGYYRDQEAYDQALACGRSVLTVDPLRESIYRKMMRLYVQKGERALAIQQYERCRQTLADELAIEPMAETKELYRQLLDQRPKPAARHAPINRSNGRPDNLQQALNQLDQAMEGLEEARGQVRQAMRIVNQFVEP